VEPIAPVDDDAVDRTGRAQHAVAAAVGDVDVVSSRPGNHDRGSLPVDDPVVSGAALEPIAAAAAVDPVVAVAAADVVVAGAAADHVVAVAAVDDVVAVTAVDHVVAVAALDAVMAVAAVDAVVAVAAVENVVAVATMDEVVAVPAEDAGPTGPRAPSWSWPAPPTIRWRGASPMMKFTRPRTPGRRALTTVATCVLAPSRAAGSSRISRAASPSVPELAHPVPTTTGPTAPTPITTANTPITARVRRGKATASIQAS
jgi:hypothetical protein